MADTNARQVQLCTVIEAQQESDQALWALVIDELNNIVQVARDVSDTLSNTTQSTHEKTLQEISDRLLDVFRQLEEFDEWLDDMTDQHWRTLQTQIRKTIPKIRDPTLWGALTAYTLTGSNDQTLSPAQIRDREAVRFEARNLIKEFVKELRSAIRHAKHVAK